jgi:ribosomal protein S18 acetylase RimI-like enzyme
MSATRPDPNDGRATNARRQSASACDDLAVPELCRFTCDHLEGVLRLCDAEAWPYFPEDPERTLRVLTAPGVTTVVAVDRDQVIGFAQLFSDGKLQAFLANLAVSEDKRGRGFGRSMVVEGLRLAGGQRVDLLSGDAAVAFYESFPHLRKPGFRLYPFHGNGASEWRRPAL